MSIGRAIQQSLPLRAVSSGFRAGLALTGASIQAATAVAGAAGSVASAGVGLATLPARQAAKLVSREFAGSALARHCSRSDGRAWIEVRSLAGPNGPKLASTMLGAVRALPGVSAARLNHPLSRLVVEIDPDAPDAVSLRELCRVVTDAENRCRSRQVRAADGQRPAALPGDGLVLAARAVTVGANTAGLGAAVLGRLLRLPGLPLGLEATVVAVDYQPRLRALLEGRIGKSATDTALSLASAIVHTLNQAPTALAVDLLVEGLKNGEERAAALAWRRREPELAGHAEHPPVPPRSRPVPRPAGPVERHGDRSAWIQALGAAAVGAVTRSPDMAGTAVAVSAPKAARTAREAFAATLGRGLADQHGVVVLRPGSLRELDRVSMVIIDPRVLCADTLRVVHVRGADDDELAKVWERAQARLDQDGLRPGWHPVGSGPGGPEASYQPALKPLASAVVTEARRADVEVVSVDVDALGELRPLFDEVCPFDGAALDDALIAAVIGYQRQGHDVAVLSAIGLDALAAADVALGMIAGDGSPPWCADLLLSSLADAWRVLHALPAARSASRRGVEMAIGA
ncbi:MAG TPA: cation-translocating P-type ATPase, partial [Mycobacterium sp.]|nr:cation-translocating P-type ATPase [Mycobacterium sp.]